MVESGGQEPYQGWMELLREEAIAVATVMRQNTRFALTSRKGEHELLKGVTDTLRKKEVSQEEAVAPFIAVMVSSETTGCMTGAALASTSRLVDSRAISSPLALHQLLQAVISCQFEETDRSEDELVIMQMLEAVTAIVTCPQGTILGSECLVHCVETLLRLLAETRCSSLLRHTALSSLSKILRSIFLHLSRLPIPSETSSPVQASSALHGPEQGSDAAVAQATQPESLQSLAASPDVPALQAGQSCVEAGQGGASAPQTDESGQGGASAPQTDESGQGGASAPQTDESGHAVSRGDVSDSQLAPAAEGACHDDRGEGKGEAWAAQQGSGGGEAAGAEGGAEGAVSRDGHVRNLIQISPDLHKGEETSAEAEVAASMAELKQGLKREHVFGVLATLIDSLANVQEGPGLESLPTRLLTLIGICVSSAGKALSNPPRPYTHLVTARLFSVIAVHAMAEDPERLAAALSLSRKLYLHLRGETAAGIEVLMSRIVLVVGEERRASTALKGVVLEGLGEMCVMPGLLQELYLNFDCCLPSPNLFQKIILFLSKSALPISPPLSSDNVKALEALRRSLKTLSEDEGEVTVSVPEPSSRARELSVQKLMKRRLETAADHFNRKPAKGMAYLHSVGVVSDPITAAELSWFLTQAEGLDKTVVGDFLGERDELNLAVLKAFAESFDFSGMQIDDALRYFLSKFRLPGESQKIDRITEAFAIRYYDQHVGDTNQGIFHSSDAVHILTFSVIMLNTDLHNPQNKKRMTLEEFIRNNRGINENKVTKKSEDIPKELLTSIYNNIQTNEIKLNETAVAKSKGPRSAESWEKEIMGVAKAHPEYVGWAAARGLEGEMFAGVWGPVLAGALAAAESAWTFQQLHLPMQTLDAAAALASKHSLSAPLDHLLTHLVTLTTIPSMAGSNVHSLAETLGSSPKAQSSLAALSKIAREYGDAVREGWSAIVTVVVVLHTAGLLELHPEAPPASPAPPRKAGSDWQWLAGWSEASKDVSEKNAEAVGKKLVQDCKIAQVFQEDTQFLSVESLHALVQALAASQASESHPTLPLLVLSSISVANRDRIEAYWGVLVERVEAAVSNEGRGWDGPVASSVEAVASLAARAILVPSIAPEVPRMLTMMGNINEASLETIAGPLSKHIHDLLATEGEALAKVGGVITAVVLLEKIGKRFPAASGFAVEGVGLVGLGSLPLAEAEWKQCLSSLSALASADAALEAQSSRRALDYLFAMQKSGVEQGGESRWLAVLGAVSSACLARSPTLRDYAFLSLERLMLVPAPPPGPPGGPEVSDGPQTCPGATAWKSAFDQVLFQVFEGLMDEKRVSKWQPVGLDKSRLRAWLLVCKVLLHQLQLLSGFPYFSQLWLSFLKHTEGYMMRQHATELHKECVPQQLHNLIEVMQLHGIFSREGAELDGNALWNQTWTTVHRFCPELKPPEVDASDDGDGKEANASAAAAAAAVLIASVPGQDSASGAVVVGGNESSSSSLPAVGVAVGAAADQEQEVAPGAQ